MSSPCTCVVIFGLLKLLLGQTRRTIGMQNELVSLAVLGILLCYILWLCDCISYFEMLLQSRKNVVFTNGCYHSLYLVMVINTGEIRVISTVLQTLSE